MPPSNRLRRSPWIVSYWSQEDLIYENYFTGVRISAAPLTTVILNFFHRWKRPEALISAMGEYSADSVTKSVARLASLTFLERETEKDPRRRAMEAWRAWEPEASFFHFATKNVPYLTESPFSLRGARQYVRNNPQPPFFKRYSGAPVIPLPRHGLPQKSEFMDVLYARRTWREFSRQKLPLTTLSHLLRLTWGVTHFTTDRVLGAMPLKTSPSGGARHVIEVYVVPLRVEGMRQGIYHYSSDRHYLERLRIAPMKRRIIRYLGGQWWFGGAAAVFIMTAVFPRTMWKYKYSRTYRSVLLDAGHLCQTFCLTSTWLGLAPFCTMALADSAIEADIGADGITESAIYAAGVGVRP